MNTKLLTIALCLPLLASAADRPAAQTPNVVVFLVDDMGVMDMSVPCLKGPDGQPTAYPLNERYHTPNLERLAERGIRFERFYANSVCSPTRISLITGQSSARHRSTQWIRSENKNTGKLGDPEWNWAGPGLDTPTLARSFNAVGYHTIYCGKAHFGPLGKPSETPDGVGFTTNIAGCSWGQPGSYYGVDHFGHKKGNKRRAVPGLEKYHGEDIYLTEALTREMKAELTRTVERKQPFLAYMAPYAVHAPFQPDPRFVDRYPDLEGRPLAYATMISAIDQSIGDLLDHLDHLGVADNTLVLFLGDNGGDAPLGSVHGVASSAPLRGKKGTHYEGGMRVPFMVAWARPDAGHAVQAKLPISAGGWTRELGNVTDVLPTLIALCGADYPAKVDGVNLAPVLAGGERPGPSRFLMHFPHDHRSAYYSVLIEGNWKLIYHYQKPADQRIELFDLAADPYEQTNLSESRPEERTRMIQLLIQELEAAGAGYPRSPQGDVLKPER